MRELTISSITAELLAVSLRRGSTGGHDIDNDNMSKELPHMDQDGPPGLFHMFDQNHTFYFESDISALPHPPQSVQKTSDTATATLYSAGIYPLRKRQSMPQLSVAGSGHQSDYAVQNSMQDSFHMPAAQTEGLHLPSAIMTSAPLDSNKMSVVPHVSSGEAHNNRYQTGPSYRSNSILKSFRHEFNIFGHRRHQSGPSQDQIHAMPESEARSVSCPPSPRRESSPDLTSQIEAYTASPGMTRSRSNSDLRKLSLVPEVSTEQESGHSHSVHNGGMDTTVAVPKPANAPDNNKDKSGLLTQEKPKVSIESMVDGKDLPITRRVMTWFTTPQTNVSQRTVRGAMNAYSPSSF